MGLIKQNYEIKELGIIVPKAYAIIDELAIQGNYARASFIVQTDREATRGKKPLERVDVEFTLNRNESPFITAYNTAKSRRVVGTKQLKNGSTEDIYKEYPFYGWQDDIV